MELMVHPSSSSAVFLVTLNLWFQSLVLGWRVRISHRNLFVAIIS